MSREDIVRLAKKSLRTKEAKEQVARLVREGFSEAPEGAECIRADDPRFAQYGAYSFSDIAVLLRFQENLIFSCSQWKQ